MIMKVLELYRKSQHFHETIRLVYNTVLNFTIFFSSGLLDSEAR